MKFELFQQHPAVEYEPHLDRVTRQLRDIREKVSFRFRFFVVVGNRQNSNLEILV